MMEVEDILMIILEDDLIISSKKFNLIPLKLDRMINKNCIYISFDNIIVFFEYASFKNVGEIIYHYEYYDIEEYIIPKDWFSAYPESFKTLVREHNDLINNQNFSDPRNLKIFILVDGTLIGCNIDNNWMSINDILPAEETFEKIEDHFSKDVSKIKKFAKQQKENDQFELMEIMFKDPEFKYCKNQHLRYQYLADLLEKENMDKYQYLVDPFGAPHIGNAKNLLDKAWMIFKEKGSDE